MPSFPSERAEAFPSYSNGGVADWFRHTPIWALCTREHGLVDDVGEGVDVLDRSRNGEYRKFYESRFVRVEQWDVNQPIDQSGLSGDHIGCCSRHTLSPVRPVLERFRHNCLFLLIYPNLGGHYRRNLSGLARGILSLALEISINRSMLDVRHHVSRTQVPRSRSPPG